MRWEEEVDDRLGITDPGLFRQGGLARSLLGRVADTRTVSNIQGHPVFSARRRVTNRLTSNTSEDVDV